jgi:hypothetical protein
MPENVTEFEEFLNNLGGGEEEDENPLFDPNQIITLRSTTGGQDFAIPVDEPITIAELISSANLTVSQEIEYWVDSVQVGQDHVVAPGGTVTAVGMVKGGQWYLWK